MITRLYTLFLGLLMSLFVGVGIAAFYHAPKSPEYPPSMKSESTTPAPDPAAIQREKDYQAAQDAYNAAYRTYNRNVSLMALAGAVVFVALGLTVLSRVAIINDSLLLGGVFTLIYSIIRGFGAGDDAFRFMLVTASPAIAITLGYIKLIRPMEAAKKRK